MKRARRGGHGRGGRRNRNSSERSVPQKVNRDSPIDFPSISRKKSKAEESDVGVELFLSEAGQLNGSIKKRMVDFHVSEIGLDDRVAALTEHTPLPAAPIASSGASELPEFTELEVLTNLDESSALEAWLSMGNSRSPEFEFQMTLDKSKRTQVHQFIRGLRFKPALCSDTTEDGRVRVRVKKLAHNADRRDPQWSKGNPQYVRFILHKINIDTIQAIDRVCNMLRVPTTRAGFAGTKDKRAVTSQWVTMYQQTPDRILQIATVLRDQGIVLGHPHLVHDGLSLGHLKGNRFHVVFRDMDVGKELEIEQSILALKETGFINYFGMQRFGSGCVSTHELGRELLRGGSIAFVQMLLAPREYDFPNEGVKNARLLLQGGSRDYLTIQKMIPRFMSAERDVLYAMNLLGDDNLDLVVNKISRTLRMMYVHAYQSYLWNSATTARLGNAGLRSGPIIGDLVMVSDSELGMVPYVLTEADLPRYAITDVVLPLLCDTSVMPQNFVAEIYSRMLADDRMTMAHLSSQDRNLGLSPSYRALVVKPTILEWEIMRYSDPEIALIRSDVDVLNNVVLEDQSGGSNLGAKIKFDLPSSSYATMLFREMTKQSSIAI